MDAPKGQKFCDTFLPDCDVYFKVYIGDKKYPESPVITTAKKQSPNYIYVSDRISKMSNITIEAWDEDTFPKRTHDPIQKIQGNVGSFLARNVYEENKNFIITATFWRDEYPETH